MEQTIDWNTVHATIVIMIFIIITGFLLGLYIVNSYKYEKKLKERLSKIENDIKELKK